MRKGYKQCSVEGCVGNVIAKEMCDLHYRRHLHHGKLESTRPTDWGLREKHPLYEQWRWIQRSRKSIDERWSDFWKFVTDVGGPPGDDYRLYRRDESQPYGPANFFWREKIYRKRKSESEKEYARRYMREYRKANPERFRDHSLRKSFGIGVEQYEAMLEAQDGVCFICKKGNTVIDNRTGRARMLSVDHCHRTGHVRKLLCQGCNQGLGNFRDDPVLLRRAASYLEN